MLKPKCPPTSVLHGAQHMPLPFPKNVQYPQCLCEFAVAPWGASSHSLGTVDLGLTQTFIPYLNVYLFFFEGRGTFTLKKTDVVMFMK